MQKVHHQASRALWLIVGIRFQVYFTPLTRVLFTFPSRYLFTIGYQLVFSLGGWSPQIQTGFHVSGSTQVLILLLLLSSTGLSPYVALLSRKVRLDSSVIYDESYNPVINYGLGSSHFARRYYGNLVWFLFLCLLRCFSSAGIASITYVFSYG